MSDRRSSILNGLENPDGFSKFTLNRKPTRCPIFSKRVFLNQTIFSFQQLVLSFSQNIPYPSKEISNQTYFFQGAVSILTSLFLKVSLCQALYYICEIISGQTSGFKVWDHKGTTSSLTYSSVNFTQSSCNVI